MGNHVIDKCESCGKEGVETRLMTKVDGPSIWVCPRCYTEIERNIAEKEYWERKKRELDY